MTPIFDQLAQELGDPLDPLLWWTTEASWLFTKWLTYSPTALRHFTRPITEAAGRWRSPLDDLQGLLRDEGLHVTYVRSFP